MDKTAKMAIFGHFREVGAYKCTTPLKLYKWKFYQMDKTTRRLLQLLCMNWQLLAQEKAFSASTTLSLFSVSRWTSMAMVGSRCYSCWRSNKNARSFTDLPFAKTGFNGSSNNLYY